MKHKRLIVSLTSLIFVVIFFLCLTSLFSIKDVTVKYTVLDNNIEYSEVSENLACFENRNLIFLDLKEVEDKLKNNGYFKIESVKKIYPNRLEVKIQERVEVFAVQCDDGFYILDNDFYVVAHKEKNENRLDGVRNILLTVNVEGFDTHDIRVGQTLSVVSHQAFIAMSNMYRSFSDSRNIISNILIAPSAVGDTYRVTFTMVEGVKIEIWDVAGKDFVNNETKINKAIDAYDKLDDYKKTKGKILSFTDIEGTVRSRYDDTDN